MDGKIHIPARRNCPGINEQGVVRINKKAQKVLNDLYVETTLSMKELVSQIIIQSEGLIVLDKEE